MVVNCWTENGKWRIDEKTASLIPGLRTLFQTKKDKFGLEYAAYCILVGDPLSPYYGFEEADLEKVVAHAIWADHVPIKALKDKLIGDAIEEYKRIANTKPAQAMAALESVMNGITKILKDTTVTTKNMEEMLEVGLKLPGLIEKHKKMWETTKVEEGNIITKVRGDGTLSYAERKIMAVA